MTAPNFEGRNRTPLDDQLDAALAKYAAVEPRAGLEERILANLKAQEPSDHRIAWWRWAVTMATALLIMTVLIWRAERHRSEEMVHLANSQQTQRQVATNTAAESGSHAIVRKTPMRHRKHTRTAALAEAEPKLDQFPSPRPLTEQEKLLAEYVSQFHQEAVLVARARAEVLRQDLEHMHYGTEADDDNVEHSK
jgi:hypothetical protein